MEQFGRLILIIGLLLVGAGLMITVFGKTIPFGRLPGDLVFKGDNATFYFPLMSSIVISIILSILFRLFMR